MSFLDEIVWRPQPDDQFINEDFKKEQIYLHHTAGGANPKEAIGWWNQTKERVGTAFLIAGHAPTGAEWKDGQIWQAFGSAKAAWHLGVTKAHIKRAGKDAKSSSWLNMNSVGIEIASWGWLTPSVKGFKTYENDIISDEQVYELSTPFRGKKFFQKYTDAQIESTRKLLVYLGDRYDIPLKWKGMEMFDFCPRAFHEPGIWTHCSVRPAEEQAKWDVYPYPPLIQMLQSL
jgi:N-acetyl-anhydromuramyl-L-alanine amidase AmpD